MYTTISFYRYFTVEDPLQLKNKMQELCHSYNLKGRILVAKEGINAAVSGRKEDINSFKMILRRDFLPGLTFREQEVSSLAHNKLVIRVRKEIVHFGREVNLKNRGETIKPELLQQWFKEGQSPTEASSSREQEDFLMVDARNTYESAIGKFKNSLTLPLQNFREFAEKAEDLKKYKDRKIVLYCTGGIRCEKASSYLKENGFSKVYHLEGGIINYLNYVSEKDLLNYWQGGLFVFDNRLVSETGNSISHCGHCGNDCERCYNCFNLDCDRLFLSCSECLEKMHNTCSEKCKNAPRQRGVNLKEHNGKRLKAQKVAPEKLGVVQNYYSKRGVALVKLEREISFKQLISFLGKTTSFNQSISELRNEKCESILSSNSGEIITFPVLEKVRKGDLVLAVT